MAAKRRKLNFEEMIKGGENPKGFTSQTSNGTSKAMHRGWNKQWPDYEKPEAPEGGAWQSPNSNRAGE